MDKNLIECATCGYPLTEDERFGLIEINGKMHRPWVGLTDEEIREIDDTCCYSLFSFSRAIEAKLREKNAPGWQSVQNPTEYLDELRGGKDDGNNKDL